MATMIWWIKNRNKAIINISIILWVFSITMSVSRFVGWIHWLTDVLFWTLIGIIIPIILFKKNIYSVLNKYSFAPLIKLEKKIFKIIFWINQ
jgi:membrane-associated phospholipid phosphatase